MIKFWLTVITIAVLLSACAFLQPSIDSVAEKVAEYVDAYCDDTNFILRAEMDTAVNSKMTVEGRSITIQCEAE